MIAIILLERWFDFTGCPFKSNVDIIISKSQFLFEMKVKKKVESQGHAKSFQR